MCVLVQNSLKSSWQSYWMHQHCFGNGLVQNRCQASPDPSTSYWPRFLTLWGIIRPQWVNDKQIWKLFLRIIFFPSRLQWVNGIPHHSVQLKFSGVNFVPTFLTLGILTSLKHTCMQSGDHVNNGLWAHEPNLTQIYLSFNLIFNHITILHMSQQLSCQDIASNVTWLEHIIKVEQYAFLHLLYHEVLKSLWNVPVDSRGKNCSNIATTDTDIHNNNSDNDNDNSTLWQSVKH